MSKKLILAFAVLGLLTASAKKGPKTYNWSLAEPAMLGSAKLEPGDYHLQIDGSKAIISATNLKQPVEASVVVHNAAKKYDQTEVVFQKNPGGNEKITRIMLHGTNMQIDFPN